MLFRTPTLTPTEDTSFVHQALAILQAPVLNDLAALVLFCAVGILFILFLFDIGHDRPTLIDDLRSLFVRTRVQVNLHVQQLLVVLQSWLPKVLMAILFFSLTGILYLLLTTLYKIRFPLLVGITLILFMKFISHLTSPRPKRRTSPELDRQARIQQHRQTLVRQHLQAMAEFNHRNNRERHRQARISRGRRILQARATWRIILLQVAYIQRPVDYSKIRK